MGRKRKEPTYILTLRVSEVVKRYAESKKGDFNKIVLQLLESQDDFQKFVRDYKENPNQMSFDFGD
nr:unnamed protein product [uncultured bacterium]